MARDTPGFAEIPSAKSIAQSPLVTLRALLIPALVLLAIYCFHLRFYRNYFPFGDDPALLHASEGNPAKWFTEGYSKYFVVYPEWNVPRTDFLRPVVNLIVRLNYLFFGEHYLFYFATFYLAQFLVCVVVVCLARRFGVSQRWLYFIALLAAINPAFLAEGLYSVSFHFDIWCGLFTVLALYLILLEHNALAVLSLTLAVFTKESALFAPIAAAMTVYLIRRRKLIALSMLLPLAAWAWVWKFVFIGSPAGNYALQGDPKALLMKGSIEGFLRWPTGIFDYHVARKLLFEHSVLAHLPDLVVLLINLLLWGFLFALGAHFARAAFPPRSLSEEDRSVLAVLIWLAGALSFGVLVGYDARFGGSIYPLEIVTCAIIFHARGRSLVRPFAAWAIGSLAVAFLWNLQTMVPGADGPGHHSAQISTMRSLVDSLRRYRADVIYVLNSSRSDATPSNIASLAGTPLETVIVLSEAGGCAHDSRADPAVVQPVGEAVHIVSILPACASYEFNGVKASILEQAFGGLLLRDHWARYSLPQGRILEHGWVNNSAIAAIDLGRELNLDLYPEQGKSWVILYYDWSKGSFLCGGAHCSSPPDAK